MNVLILMAGSNEEFNKEGYLFPKNLIEVKGQPLVSIVIEDIN